MKMFRNKSAFRALIGLTIAAIVVGAAGCSSAPEPTAGSSDGSDGISGDLTIAYLSGNVFLDEMIEEFQEEYPDVKIRGVQATSNTYQAQIRSQLDADQGPDVMHIWTGSGNAMAAKILGGAGKLADLTDRPWAEAMDPAAKSLVSLDGKIYGYTSVANPYGFVYNPDMMDELGLTVPETFSDLLDTCEAARDKGKALIALGAQTGYLAYAVPTQLANSVAWTKDPEYLNKLADGEETWTDSKVWKDSLTEGYELYQQMIDGGCFQDSLTGYSDEAAKQMVAAGDAVGTYIIINGLRTLEKQAPDMKFKFATLPATESANDLVLTSNPGSAMAVGESSKNMDAALAFIDFLTTPEHDALQAEENYGLPYTVSDQVKFNDALAPIKDLYMGGNSLLFPTAHWPNPEVKQTIIAESQKMLTGTQDVAGVVDAVQASFKGE